MKTVFLLLVVLRCASTRAQEKYIYYTWQWEPCEIPEARFTATIKNTDSGYMRYNFYLPSRKPQMAGLSEDSATTIANGYFRYFYSDGLLAKKGRYIKNKKEGLWLEYHRNGMLKDSAVFVNDEKTGIALRWYDDGSLSDSAVYTGGGVALAFSWFDNGVPASAGHYLHGKLQGPWQFYHKNGALAAKETYDTGRLVSFVDFNEQGVTQLDTANIEAEPAFVGGIEAWRKFVNNNLFYPRRMSMVNAEKVVVIVSAVIDEEGNVTDPIVELPFEEAFDKNALHLLKKSPKWLPAISHNRHIKHTIRIPVSFGTGAIHQYFY